MESVASSNQPIIASTKSAQLPVTWSWGQNGTDNHGNELAQSYDSQGIHTNGDSSNVVLDEAVGRQAVKARALLEEQRQSGMGVETEGGHFEFSEDAKAAITALTKHNYQVVLVSIALPAMAEKALQFLEDSGLVGPGKPVESHNVLFCSTPEEKEEILRRLGGFVAVIDRSWQMLEMVRPSRVAPVRSETRTPTASKTGGLPNLHKAILFNPDKNDLLTFQACAKVHQTNEEKMIELVQDYGAIQAASHRLGTTADKGSLERSAAAMAANIEVLAAVQACRPILVRSNTAAADTPFLPRYHPRFGKEISTNPWHQVCDALSVPPPAEHPSGFTPVRDGGGGGGGFGREEPFYPLACGPEPHVRAAVGAGRLPPGWEAEEFVDGRGRRRRVFVNHAAKVTTWVRPLTHGADHRANAYLAAALDPLSLSPHPESAAAAAAAAAAGGPSSSVSAGASAAGGGAAEADGGAAAGVAGLGAGLLDIAKSLGQLVGLAPADGEGRARADTSGDIGMTVWLSAEGQLLVRDLEPTGPAAQINTVT